MMGLTANQGVRTMAEGEVPEGVGRPGAGALVERLMGMSEPVPPGEAETAIS